MSPKAAAFRLFNVAVGASLTLEDLTLTGGLAQGANGTSGSGGGGGGGGLGRRRSSIKATFASRLHAGEQPGCGR